MSSVGLHCAEIGTRNAAKIARALSQAQSLSSVDEFIRLIWHGVEEDELSDVEAQELNQIATARRNAPNGGFASPFRYQPKKNSVFSPRRRP